MAEEKKQEDREEVKVDETVETGDFRRKRYRKYQRQEKPLIQRGGGGKRRIRRRS